MGINKVSFNGNTLIDLTEDTISEDVLLEGYSAHDASGNSIIGTYSGLKLTRTEELPEIGEENCIYLIENDEFFYAYIWQGENFKLIGNSPEDLSDYIKRSEVIDWTEEDLGLETLVLLEQEIQVLSEGMQRMKTDLHIMQYICGKELLK